MEIFIPYRSSFKTFKQLTHFTHELLLGLHLQQIKSILVCQLGAEERLINTHLSKAQCRVGILIG